MGDEDQGGPRRSFGPEAVQVLDQPPAGDAVEGGEGLVEQQQVRPGDQGPGEGDAHRHAARKLARTSRQAVAQADGAQGLSGPTPRLFARDIGQLERQGDIGLDVGPGHQGGVLEDEAGPAAARAPGHLSLRRRLKSGQQAQEGGLAGAGRPDEGEDFAGRDGQIDGPQRRPARVADDGAPQRRRDRRAGLSHGRAGTGS